MTVCPECHVSRLMIRVVMIWARELCTDLLAFIYSWGKLRITSSKRPSIKAVRLVAASNGIPFIKLRSVGSHSTSEKEVTRSWKFLNTWGVREYEHVWSCSTKFRFIPCSTFTKERISGSAGQKGYITANPSLQLNREDRYCPGSKDKNFFNAL